jgi:hypothetical protein
MGDEKIKYHEHDMKPVDKPAVASAKKFCIVVLIILTPLIAFYLTASHAVQEQIDKYATWPCAIVAVIVGIVTVRALMS